MVPGSIVQVYFNRSRTHFSAPSNTNWCCCLTNESLEFWKGQKTNLDFSSARWLRGRRCQWMPSSLASQIFTVRSLTEHTRRKNKPKQLTTKTDFTLRNFNERDFWLTLRRWTADCRSWPGRWWDYRAREPHREVQVCRRATGAAALPCNHWAAWRSLAPAPERWPSPPGHWQSAGAVYDMSRNSCFLLIENFKSDSVPVAFVDWLSPTSWCGGLWRCCRKHPRAQPETPRHPDERDRTCGWSWCYPEHLLPPHTSGKTNTHRIHTDMGI